MIPAVTGRIEAAFHNSAPAAGKAPTPVTRSGGSAPAASGGRERDDDHEEIGTHREGGDD